MSIFFFLFLEWQKAKKNAEQETIEEITYEVEKLKVQNEAYKICIAGINYLFKR